MAEVRDLEIGVQATEAMPQVVMCILGQRSDRLRGASSGAGEMLSRGVENNHSMVRNDAEPMGGGRHLQAESAGTAAPSRVAQVPLARRVGEDMGKRAAPTARSQSLSWLLKRRSSSSRGPHKTELKSVTTKTGEEKTMKASRAASTSALEFGPGGADPAVDTLHAAGDKN